jgi:hypothetical protein
MTDFRQLLYNYQENEQFASNSRTMLLYLKDAMAPFVLVSPTVELSYECDYRVYKIRLRCKNLPWFKFDHRFSQDAVLSLYEPDIIFHELGLALLEYWRSIPRVTPEDNVILGSE